VTTDHRVFEFALIVAFGAVMVSLGCIAVWSCLVYHLPAYIPLAGLGDILIGGWLTIASMKAIRTIRHAVNA